MTVRLRLAIWYAATIAVLFALVGTITWEEYSRAAHDTLHKEIVARAEDVRLSLSAATLKSTDTVDPAWLGIFAAVFDRAGALTSGSRDTPTGLQAPTLGSHTVHLGAGGIAYAIEAIAGPGGTTIVAGSPLLGLDQSLADLARLMLLTGLVGTAVALAGGWWLARRALRPVDAMVREANTIETGDLSQRLPVPGPNDEISRLARTLNEMLDRVAETVRRERRFVAIASHDLRTPIASLQAELEVAAAHERDADALLASVRAAQADAVRLATLASDLLRLAEAESSGRELLRQPIRLDALVEGVVVRFAPLASDRAVGVRADVPGERVSVDRLRLEQVIGNLLSNAILESGPGGEVEIRAAVEPGDGRPGDAHADATLVVDVLDRGPGVPASARSQLFQPFGAGRPGRDGRTGLGLATAAAAVSAHGGSIAYRDRPGGGAWFTFSVPAGTHGTG